jgi:hypothetical protein
MAPDGLLRLPEMRAINGDTIMAQKTCAACDYPLDETAIQVTIGTRVIEVCCEECAQKLRESLPSKNS